MFLWTDCDCGDCRQIVSSDECFDWIICNLSVRLDWSVLPWYTLTNMAMTIIAQWKIISTHLASSLLTTLAEVNWVLGGEETGPRYHQLQSQKPGVTQQYVERGHMLTSLATRHLSLPITPDMVLSPPTFPTNCRPKARYEQLRSPSCGWRSSGQTRAVHWAG